MLYKLTLCLLLSQLILSTNLPAKAKPVNSSQQILKKLQHHYGHKDFSAKFSQTHFDKLKQQTTEESGRLLVSKQGAVRWTYEQPKKKEFIYDHLNAYFYEPDNQQVTIFEHFQNSELADALSFIWGQTALTAHFNLSVVTYPPPEAANFSSACVFTSTITPKNLAKYLFLRLIPKKPLASVATAMLIVDPSDYQIKRSIIYDALDNCTAYSLTELRFGIKINEDNFKFKIPFGTNILRATD